MNIFKKFLERRRLKRIADLEEIHRICNTKHYKIRHDGKTWYHTKDVDIIKIYKKDAMFL